MHRIAVGRSGARSRSCASGRVRWASRRTGRRAVEPERCRRAGDRSLGVRPGGFDGPGERGDAAVALLGEVAEARWTPRSLSKTTSPAVRRAGSASEMATIGTRGAIAPSRRWRVRSARRPARRRAGRPAAGRAPARAGSPSASRRACEVGAVELPPDRAGERLVPEVVEAADEQADDAVAPPRQRAGDRVAS